MAYLATLSPEAKKNVAILVDRMNKKGLTNPYAQAAVLAIVSKESEFVPKSENLYYKTADQLHNIFPSIFPTVASAAPYVKNPEATANKVYGGKYGNNTAGDGFRYRGRGFNQITFHDIYLKIGKLIGVDLVNYPDSLNNVTVASDAVIAYFQDAFKSAPKDKLALYNTTGINDFKTVTDSVGAFYHANAGWGHTVASIKADPTGGKKKADDRSPELFELISNNKAAATGISLGGLVLLYLGYLGVKKLTSNSEKAK